MICYRLYIQRLIDYLGFNKPSEEERLRQLLLSKKKKKYKRTELNYNTEMVTNVSLLLTILTSLACLTIPYAVLEKPCEIFKERNMYVLYFITSWIEAYWFLLDGLIVILFIILVYMFMETVFNAIDNTDISMSPWVEQGRYAQPKRPKFIIQTCRPTNF
ncbi:uncharacterized protein LOC114241161 [Bombyx mandarina]|uniref:Uncharacterized protein LOC114241161 n=1 Tax=Bombyx mandarina TaxID=7092 RepID=A0A6J2JE30_BOMMA|nr:uncharacterized protein LOC114241161 [Bombyx mandarina]